MGLAGPAIVAGPIDSDPYLGRGSQLNQGNLYTAFYYTWSLDGELSDLIPQTTLIEAPGAPVALAPTPDPDLWCSLTLNQREPTIAPGTILPTQLEDSMVQHLNLFDPATGNVAQRLEISGGSVNGRFDFGYGGARLAIAEQQGNTFLSRPLEARAVDVLSGRDRWKTELRDNAYTAYGVRWDLQSERCVATWSAYKSSTSGFYSPRPGGFSLLDADSGEPLRESVVTWDDPLGPDRTFTDHYGPVFMPTPGTESERQFIVAGRSDQTQTGADRDLLFNAFQVDDGSERWKARLDLEALSGGLGVRLGAFESDAVDGDLWLAGTIASAPSLGEAGKPFLARLAAADGSLRFFTSPDPSAVVGGPTGFANANQPVAFLNLDLPDRALIVTVGYLDTSLLPSAWITAFDKGDGSVLWTRILDPVTEGFYPLGLAVDPASMRVAVFGQRLDPAEPYDYFRLSSAAAWFDTEQGTVLGTAQGSLPDGSRWIAGAFDGPELLLGSLREGAEPETVDSGLSRWSAPE